MPRKTKQNDITSPELLSQVNSGVCPDGYYGFIYITTNTINGKKYIGQRKFYDGWVNYIGSGHALKNAIKKYGSHAFVREIIEICETQDELNAREIYWIDFCNAIHSSRFYNLMAGGNAGNKIAGYPDEWRNEHFRRCAEKLVGVPKVYKSGSHPMKGAHHTEETKRKISSSNKGKTSGEKNYAAKPVICITTGEVFDCISEAQKSYGIGNISQCCSGKRYHAGRLPDGTLLTWAYYNKDNGSYSPANDLRLRWSKRAVEQYTKTGEYLHTYPSARIASECTNTPYQKIIAVCTGSRKTSGKYIWRYATKGGDGSASQNQTE